MSEQINYLEIQIKEGERLMNRFNQRKKYYYQNHFGQWIVLIENEQDILFGPNEKDNAINYGLHRSNKLQTPCPLVFKIGDENYDSAYKEMEDIKIKNTELKIKKKELKIKNEKLKFENEMLQTEIKKYKNKTN